MPIDRPIGNRVRATSVKGECHHHCATMDCEESAISIRVRVLRISCARARAYYAGSFSARRNRILRAAKTASNTRTTMHNPGLRFRRTLRRPLPQVTGRQQQKTWTLPEGNLHWYNLILLPLVEGRVPLSHYQLKKMNTAKSAKLDIVLMMNKYVSVRSSLLRWLESGDDRTVSGRFVPSKRSYFAPNRKFV